MNLSLAFFAFAFAWHYIHGEESSYLRVGDADAAMAKTGGSFGSSVVRANDIQEGSSPGLRKIRRDIRCGDGKVGNGICPNVGECCSQYGWCGASDEHCATGGERSGSLGPGSCGNGYVGNGSCANAGDCCSRFGWCGTSVDHCGGPPEETPPPSPTAPITITTSPTGGVGMDTLSPSLSTNTGAPGSTTSPVLGTTTEPTPPVIGGMSAPFHTAPTVLTISPSTGTTSTGISTAVAAVEAILEAHKDGIDNNILLYQTPDLAWIPSTLYRYNDLLDGLRVMHNDGIANNYFYMGDDSSKGHHYGLVNIAAFLAQSMKETVRYNACDENSWDRPNGQYPLSNSCGQLGQSYQDYKCSESEAHMECPVNPNMEIKATTNAQWYGAPGPLSCAPKSKYPFTGFWDFSKQCNKPWADPPETCDVYEGQQAGGFDNSSPIPNSSGRTDVEGCCYWGRGVIQTTVRLFEGVSSPFLNGY
jgi:hypothetical protein